MQSPWCSNLLPRSLALVGTEGNPSVHITYALHLRITGPVPWEAGSWNEVDSQMAAKMTKVGYQVWEDLKLSSMRGQVADDM